MSEDAGGRPLSAAAFAAPPGLSSWAVTVAGSIFMVLAAYAGVHYVLRPLVCTEATAVEAEAANQAPVRGEIVRFENIIVNPSGTLGARYLSTTVGLEVADEAVRQAVASAEPLIQDALITRLSSQTIQQLTDPSAREALRSSVRQTVDAIISPRKISAVFFLDFVIQ